MWSRSIESEVSTIFLFFCLKSKKCALYILCNTTLLSRNVKNNYFAKNRGDSNESFDTLAKVVC